MPDHPGDAWIPGFSRSSSPGARIGLLASLVLVAQTTAVPVRQEWEPDRRTLEFFARHDFADGNVGFAGPEARRTDPDFSGRRWARVVQERIGLDLGAITMSEEATLVSWNRQIREVKYPGLFLVLDRADLAKVLGGNLQRVHRAVLPVGR